MAKTGGRGKRGSKRNGEALDAAHESPPAAASESPGVPQDTIKSPSDLLEHLVRQPTLSGRAWYRGCYGEYPLLPRAFRDEEGRGEEEARMRRFRNGATAFFNDFNPSDPLEVVARAQHHNFPTRALDWSSDPMIALFFAFEEFEKFRRRLERRFEQPEPSGAGKTGDEEATGRDEKTGDDDPLLRAATENIALSPIVLWRLDPGLLNLLAITRGDTLNTVLEDLVGGDSRFYDRLARKSTVDYATRAAELALGEADPEITDTPLPIAFTPRYVDERIYLQESRFTIFNKEDDLATQIKSLHLNEKLTPLRRFIIPTNALAEYFHQFRVVLPSPLAIYGGIEGFQKRTLDLFTQD